MNKALKKISCSFFCYSIFAISSTYADTMINRMTGLYDTDKLANASNIILCVKDKNEQFIPWKYQQALDPNKLSGNPDYWGAAVRTDGCSTSNMYYGWLDVSGENISYQPVDGSHIVLENYHIFDDSIYGNLNFSQIAYNDGLSLNQNTNHQWLTGINLSGLEFSTSPNSAVIPSLSNADSMTDYTDLLDTNHFLSEGANTVRIPVRWAYMQPYGYTTNLAETPYFDTRYFDKLVLPTLQTLLYKNYFVILDLHAYMHYSDIGSEVAGCGGPNPSSCPDGELVTNPNAYVKIWSQIWDQISKSVNKDKTKYLYLDLMNEPATKTGESLTTKEVFDTEVAIIQALNAKGFDGYYLVEGLSWSGMHSWNESGNAQTFTRENFKAAGLSDDEIDRIVINVHQYLDADFSGTHDVCINNITQVDNMDAFVTYLRENQFKAMITEFGVGRDENSCAPALNAFLNQIKQNAYTETKGYGFTGWTVWSTGHGWGNYNLRVTPNDWKDGVLKQYFLQS